MATAAGSTALSMKLLIDKKAQRVLFAEASKEVVDFLFSLLVLPVATAVKLVGKADMVGCVGNLYSSVEKLDATYVQLGAAKDALLCPTVISPAASTSLLRLPSAPSPSPSSEQPKTTLYGCSNYYDYDGCLSIYVTNVSGTPCPSCRAQMTRALQYIHKKVKVQDVPTATEAAKGFVQGIVTYTVRDDLTVTPMSAISSIALLNTFAVRDISDLQEKTVQLGYTEGLAILKASLQSQTVLTDVFLAK